MPEYYVGKKGRSGVHMEFFKDDIEFKKFCKQYGLIGYKGRKEPFSKKDWLVYD